MLGEKFVVLKSGGLGNRLKSYVSYLARYNEILVEKLQDSIIFDFKHAKEEEINSLPNTGSNWRLIVDKEEEQFIPDYSTIDFLYNKTPEYFINKYTPIFKEIKGNLDNETKTIINNFTKNLDFSKITGVHIRSSLASRGDGNRAGYVDYKRIKEIIEESDKVLLASDYSGVYKELIEKYKDKIITFPRQVFDINDVTVESLFYTREAVVEMILLSLCPRLCFTFGSTYSECCWWFGECKAQVEIPTKWDKVNKDFLDDCIRKK